MARNWVGPWAGGRKMVDRRGRERWVIERMHQDIRYSVALSAKSLDEANAELALFDRDPAAYRTAKAALREKKEGAVCITAVKLEQLEGHLRQQKRTPEYIASTVSYLKVWLKDLGARDLRTVKLRELLGALGTHETAKQKRIAALKTFTAYFREELALLEASQDPTLALKSPKAKPARAKKETGYSAEVIEKVYANVHDWEAELQAPDRFGRQRELGFNKKIRKGFGDAQAVRDLICLRAKLGMHESEIKRLALGRAKITQVEHAEIKGTIEFPHKSGAQHVVSCDAQCLAAARRMRDRRGVLSHSYVVTSLKYACERAGVDGFLPGQLRHSFVSIASDAGEEVRVKSKGVSLAAVQGVVGHAPGSRVTGLNYLTRKVPPMIKIPLTLVHPDDPGLRLVTG